MERRENTPEYWRARAQELRAMAEHLHDAAAKAHMESAAQSYDRLAKMAERGPIAMKRPKAVNDPA